jgi:hypothetical protein
MSKLDDYWKAVQDGLLNIAKGDLKDFLKQAKDDGDQFLTSVKNDVETWTKQLNDGGLSKDEFDFLVRGKADLAKMHALMEAGITAIRVQNFRDAVINLVIDTAFKVFLP